jgi:predicted secreted protein
MPDPTFIAGYLSVFTANGQDLTNISANLSVKQARAVLTKAVMGSADAYAIGGQKTGGISAKGSLSAEKAAALQAAFDAGIIAYSVQIGTASAATDAGLHSGNCVVGDFTLEAAADGEWDWSMELTRSGANTYTPVAEESSSSSSS